MHFSLKRAVGVMAVPLLGSALAVGAAALPANAATWQDTSLSASAVTASTFGGAGLGVANGTKVITLVGTGVTWSLHGTVPAGVTLSGGTISYSGTAASTATCRPTSRCSPGRARRRGGTSPSASRRTSSR